MNRFNPENLAVLACPGGEIFADQVIAWISKRYRSRFDEMIAELANHYKMEVSEVTRQVNFLNDAISPVSRFLDNEGQYQSPNLKVPAFFTYFPNGEIKAELMESIRGKDLYIIQDVENRYPVNFSDGETKKNLTINDHLLTLFVTVDAARHAGAERITLVLPVYPYSRQHKSKGREGLTGGRVGKILESMGVSRIITLDIHCKEISNAFDRIGLDSLHASYQIIRALSSIPGIMDEDLVVVSPDTGAVDRNKFFASVLKKPLALLYKERDYSKVSTDAIENNISDIKLLGDVKGKTVFMADDRLDTGGTLIKAMKFMKDKGAVKVICAVSLPIFTGDAIKHFNDAYKQGLFYKIIGTNAVYHKELLQCEWYINVDIAKLFAQIIIQLHQGLPISQFLDSWDIIAKFLFESPTT